MCMAHYGDDRPTVYRAQTRRTRKPRKCEECGRPIAVGERDQNAFSVYEGHADTFSTCEHCLVGMQWLVRTAVASFTAPSGTTSKSTSPNTLRQRLPPMRPLPYARGDDLLRQATQTNEKAKAAPGAVALEAATTS
jgi:hypothetical protein